MQRMVLNRHRRGYVTKERAQRRVPFLVPGPIGLARSQFLTSINCYHHYSHSIISIILILESYNSRVSETLDFYRYYSTKQRYDPSILVIRGFKESDKQILLMQLGINQLL